MAIVLIILSTASFIALNGDAAAYNTVLPVENFVSCSMMFLKEKMCLSYLLHAHLLMYLQAATGGKYWA